MAWERARGERARARRVLMSTTRSADVVVQGGGYGEHQTLSAEVNGRITPINARDFTVQLAPGAGARLTLAMKRYANPPTAKFPGTDRIGRMQIPADLTQRLRG
jgi:hypothetical protein